MSAYWTCARCSLSPLPVHRRRVTAAHSNSKATTASTETMAVIPIPDSSSVGRIRPTLEG
jgi:hypothetical protein